MRLCFECEKRETCQELCRDMKTELRKVTLRQKDKLIDNEIEFQTVDWPTLNIPTNPDDRKPWHHKQIKKLIWKLHSDGMSSSEIAYHLPCSQQYIHKVITTTFGNQPIKNKGKK